MTVKCRWRLEAEDRPPGGAHLRAGVRDRRQVSILLKNPGFLSGAFRLRMPIEIFSAMVLTTSLPPLLAIFGAQGRNGRF
jgi:hypothetical protein